MIQETFAHEAIVNRFKLLIEKERLAHAYLFIGPQSVGKTETAFQLAKLINCLEIRNGMFCDACPACQKITNGNHPDIHRIEVIEGDSIKIEQIRQLITESQLRAFEAKRKVFIIREIENLTLEGSNALLKTLEEPSKNSLLILTTSHPERSIETIISRCHAVHFFPMGQQKLAETLRKGYAINDFDAHFLACFSEGCFGRAQGLEKSKFLKFKNDALDEIIFSPESDSFFKSLVADKEKTKDVLNILLAWFRDLLLLKLGCIDQQLIHLDRSRDLIKYVSRYTVEEIYVVIGDIVNASKLLEENLNVKVALTLLKERLWRK